MRYGVLSDVHGNAAALRAAVGHLRSLGVDGWLCAGDVVGYGPQPNECVDLLSDLGAGCVAGNHEQLVLGGLPLDRAGRLARETTGWTRAALRDDARAWLAALPATLRLPGLVMAHGCLRDPTTYVTTEARAVEELCGLRALDPRAGVLVLGHTHRPWRYQPWPGGPVLLNPGSVGQSRQRERVPLARFALLDLDRRSVRFFAEPYDVAAVREALRRNGLPRACIHVPPGRLRAVPRRAGTLVRYARRGKLP